MSPHFPGQADAALHTEISVNTDALFSSFQHTAEEAADVTFNLRDFRVMLAWCMTMDMDMAIRFQSPGAPLLAEPHCGHGVSFSKKSLEEFRIQLLACCVNTAVSTGLYCSDEILVSSAGHYKLCMCSKVTCSTSLSLWTPRGQNNILICTK